MSSHLSTRPANGAPYGAWVFMFSHWKGILAAVGAFLGVLTGAWTLWKAYRDRAILKIAVDWEWTEMEPESCSAPRITVRNHGGRTAYIDRIEVVEANGARNVIGAFDNREVKPDQNFSYRPNWDEPSETDPQFTHGWEGLCIVVTDARGKEWRSKTPTSKPSWYAFASPLNFIENRGDA